MKLILNPLILLVLSTTTLSATFHPPSRRDEVCTSISLTAQISSGNGGRKIGFVMDISGSMAFNDPTDIRFAAARSLNSILITPSSTPSGKSPDLVSVVYFNDTSSLEYPLGDPSGAVSALQPPIPGGGTFIGGGIGTVVTELTKAGQDPTANRTAVVVFTDGIDDPATYIPDTISAIQDAGKLGIRVHFGYLSTESLNQDRGIELAVLQTGGVFTTIDSTDSTENFVDLVLLKGLTGMDAGAGGNPILSGLTTSSLLTATGKNTFTYHATAGESFNVTISTNDPLNLTATLRDPAVGTDIASQPVDMYTPAIIPYTATADKDIEVVVTASNVTAEGIFSIGLNSTLVGGQSCTGSNTTNTTNTTVTPMPTPTPTATVVPFTGGAGGLRGEWMVSGGLLWVSLFVLLVGF